jgi:hypothetical protein
MAYHAAEVDRVEAIRINYEERRLVLQEGAHPPESTTGAEGFGLFYREHHLQAVASGTPHPCGQVVSQMARVEDDLAHSGLGERFKVIVEQRPISDWDQGLRQVGGQRKKACTVPGRQYQRATHLMIDGGYPPPGRRSSQRLVGTDAQMVQQYRPVEYTATPVVVPPR